jgi:hypothetical protein
MAVEDDDEEPVAEVGINDEVTERVCAHGCDDKGKLDEDGGDEDAAAALENKVEEVDFEIRSSLVEELGDN